MIQVEQLHKSYGRIKALQGVSLQLSVGKITGILGPNGCGKTTLIKSILGLVVPDQGSIEVKGEPILGQCDYRKHIGYMPQNADFPQQLKIRELFDMLEDIRAQKASGLQKLIDMFELKEHLDRAFGVLSGGTQQKVAAISALMFAPSILVLDEPTVGLDPLAVSRLKGLVSETVKKGATVLLVTHMVSEIEQLVDEMVFLLEGRVRFSGSLERVKSEAQTSKLEDAVVKLIEEGRTS